MFWLLSKPQRTLTKKRLLAGALADTANQKSDAALQGVMTNGTEIINMENVNKVQDNRLDSLESAPKTH